MITPIILAGGSGTRLWPLSRKLQPKQFINLVNETTLFQDTLLRLPKNTAKPVVICNEDHRFLVAEQARQINKKLDCIILEPFGKNTAPAIALAAIKLRKNNKNPTLLILAADHLIKDLDAFHRAINISENLVNENKLITFGIVPDRVETGYGYIEAKINNEEEQFDILSFTEKPNEKNASNYIKSGNYFWNSGMFMFSSSKYLDELRKFNLSIYEICKKSIKNELKDIEFIRIDKEEFVKCPNLSIDYAVMEKTSDAKVVPLDAGWSDVGSWDTLMNSKTRDSFGNVSEGDVLLENVQNSYIYSSNRLIAAMNISDLIIIDTQDALLISNKNNSSGIKRLVDQLKSSNRTESENHRKVYRPWGYYDSIDIGQNFQVKKISVNPGAKLSLQKHLYIAEHWVVVRGTAKITRGDQTFYLRENQSTYI